MFAQTAFNTWVYCHTTTFLSPLAFIMSVYVIMDMYLVSIDKSALGTFEPSTIVYSIIDWFNLIVMSGTFKLK